MNTEIGKQFLQYYQYNRFEILQRSSLLDPDLPMTFVGSAGLSQIESAIEQGEEHTGERYVLLQPCFRHFDMQKIGRSPVHLSLFEMAGAFAFGNEAKEDALGKIWTFLTEQLGLDNNRFWVTYFAGGELDGNQFKEDADTLLAWQKIGIPARQIVAVGAAKGFWKQGGGLLGIEQFRKCGPTTELFFDKGREYCCGPTCQPGCRCGRFIEIANVLFIHSRIDQETQSIEPLITPFTETVIGGERVTMAVQREPSVFDIDGLASLIEYAHSYYTNETCIDPEQILISERIIVDHLRALLFLVADGAPPPGKGGQRRIIRTLIRNIRTHQKILSIRQEGFLLNVLDITLKLYEDYYPNLKKGYSRLLEYFDNESKCFERTLAAGYRQLEKIMRLNSDNALSGQQAFKLVKCHGVPFSLLETKLAQMGINFNRQDYWEAYAHWQQMQ